jgi:hypothetical protein
MLSSLKNVFLQLHVQCVSYHSGEYKYILLCCSSCENIRQKPFYGTNTATMISSVRDDENGEDGKLGRLRRPGSLGG